jgi:hypothetical protein
MSSTVLVSIITNEELINICQHNDYQHLKTGVMPTPETSFIAYIHIPGCGLYPEYYLYNRAAIVTNLYSITTQFLASFL